MNSGYENAMFKVELVWLTGMQESQVFCTWRKRYLLALVSSQFRPTAKPQKYLQVSCK